MDQWTKTTLAELRKMFERFDSVTLLKPFLVNSVGALPEPEPVHAALADVCARLYLTGEEGAGPPVDPRTGPGKLFDRVTEQLGMQGKLLRSAENAPALCVHAGEVATIAVRTDLLSAPPSELAYIFSYGLMLARPACAALSCAAEGDRAVLVQALAALATEHEITQDDPVFSALVGRLEKALTPEELKAWREHLADLPKIQRAVMQHFAAIDAAALRVAVVAAGDVRAATRAMARLSPDNKRPPGVGKVEDFEHFFASMPASGVLLSFAASDDFGRLLAASA